MPPAQRAVTTQSIEPGLTRVRARIADACAASGRTPDEVAVLAAVKYVDADACALLARAGIVDLAENRADQLAPKQAAVSDDHARWHFIGRLQSRQAARIAEQVAMIHTLCSTSAAAKLAAGTARPELLVQVNIDEDPAKDGLAPHDVEAFLLAIPDTLTVSGFMAMPAFTTDPEQSRGAFAALRRLRDALAPKLAGRHDLRALSMGTSQDYVVAVEEGATHVRLGRILYDDAE